MEEILESLSGEIFAVWFLIGAALVFWMQAGFAMVESGFARAKNAGNILMKNLMDFCIGTCVFILIGFSLLLGEDLAGFIGKPGSTSSQPTRALTGPTSCSTWCSVPPRLLSCPAPWRSGPGSYPTASIPASFRR